MSDWFPQESLSPPNKFLPPQDDPGTEERPVREELPPNYRMRYDRHFVDELDARSPEALIQMVPTKDIQSPDSIAVTEVGPLVDSVRKVGVLQPVLVRQRWTPEFGQLAKVGSRPRRRSLECHGRDGVILLS